MGEYREEKYVVMGYSTVARLWKKVFFNTEVGDDISNVIEQCGKPDIVDNVDGGIQLLFWNSHEFKGWVRGGYWTRQIAFAVKDGKIIEKHSANLDLACM